ncbi:MAG: hypothetical protein ETSY1_42490, partial [Candidatus Entotheonella factor]
CPDTRALGDDHADVAIRLNSLALVYKDRGCYEEAEPLYRLALHIGETVLEPDHTDVAMWLSNLADPYQDQGRYEEAEPLYQRSIAILEVALGSNHPNTQTARRGYDRLQQQRDAAG